MKMTLHSPPPKRANASHSSSKEDNTKFAHHIPCLLLSKSPLLQIQKRSDELAKQVILAKYMYSKCDPLVRSFVTRGSTDEGANFKLSRDVSGFVPGLGGARLEIISDESTGVSFAFEGGIKRVSVSFRPDEKSEWFLISNNRSDFMYLASLQMTLNAIMQKDSELSHMREVEAARSKVMAMYGNK